MNIKSTMLCIAMLAMQSAFAQDTLRVLFLGNSYTSYNNLPQLVQSLSTAAGKTMIVDSNMPGGMTVSGHINDPTSLAKISQGTWDYVVIQEQSQIPSIDFYRYNDMYPAMNDLKVLVEQSNPCSRIITYMTWGRRFGGQQCDPTNTYCSPVFADFNHMQDSLTSAYTEISDLLNMQCAPVGVTWQNILNDTALVLHSSDNSHPNLDGSYVAALTLYSSIWKEPTSGISYTAGLTPSLAQYYQQMSDTTVFHSQRDWNLSINDPLADFMYSVSGTTATFINTSTSLSNAPLTYAWTFGDGNTSNLQNPSHTYLSNGLYTVTLVVTDCIFSDTISYG
ncbi:MAG: PKD domain-containing protein, partial [Bacteroidota bacterium]